MDIMIIKHPSIGTFDIIGRRSDMIKDGEDMYNADAIGLVQGKMIEMIVAADIAEKAAGVFVKEIRGSCPQNMILIAIFGDTSSVEAAIEKIKTKMGKEL